MVVQHTTRPTQQPYPQLIYGTPVQLRHTQTEAVGGRVQAYTRPALSQEHYGIGEGRCGRCEPSPGVVDEVCLAVRIPVCSYCCCCQPEFDLAQLESRHDGLD